MGIKHMNEKAVEWFKHRSSWGLLALRVIAGVLIMMHGYAKLMSLDGTGKFFMSIGIPAAAAVAVLVALVEFLGGIAFITGFLTRHAAALTSIVMFFAVVLTKLPAIATKGVSAADPELALLAASLCLLFAGPGKWAASKQE